MSAVSLRWRRYSCMIPLELRQELRCITGPRSESIPPRIQWRSLLQRELPRLPVSRQASFTHQNKLRRSADLRSTFANLIPALCAEFWNSRAAHTARARAVVALQQVLAQQRRRRAESRRGAKKGGGRVHARGVWLPAGKRRPSRYLNIT